MTSKQENDDRSKERTGNAEAAQQVFYSARNHEKVMDSIVDEFAKKGGFDDLPGKGKPLKLKEGDVLSHVMQEARIMPPWLELQREIAKEMRRLLAKQEAGRDLVSDQEIEALNDQIRQFNRSVPSSLLQKGLVSSVNLAVQIEKWE
ncbi:DUF1992 domain-containing protein [Paenibacillus aquistagni]|uniref:DnaJ family domain-containing protein n=1 Tax=Paenibacillus aquistagni TaxID=1852522 RepID=UPI00145AC9AE|nr:DUF1992 domain-containing protein [Paenibacillus aquistagni]NMM53629.1 DUF1992 domain-containing protein [Paenibacillus aquistagni]